MKYYFLLGMAAQALMTAGLTQLGMLSPKPGQQALAGILFLGLAFILKRR